MSQQLFSTLDSLTYPAITQPQSAITYNDRYKLRWNNRMARNRVYQCSIYFGKGPDFVNPDPGGYAIWNRPPAINAELRAQGYHYDMLTIRDMSLLHTKPVNHSDFMFLQMYLPLKQKIIKKMAKVTDSFMFYGLGSLAYAVCGEIEANIATLVVAKLLNSGAINKINALERYNAYIKMILKEFFDNEKNGRIENAPAPIRDAFERYLFDIGNNMPVSLPGNPSSRYTGPNTSSGRASASSASSSSARSPRRASSTSPRLNTSPRYRPLVATPATPNFGQ